MTTNEKWGMSLDARIVDTATTRRALQNRATFWIRHRRRRCLQIYNAVNRECWEWRGTWVKIRDAETGAGAAIGEKVQHVLRAGQDRQHGCHWPGCNRQVPPAKWGCRTHWKLLPRNLRNAIWRAYSPGQEVTGTPSQKYIETARRVQAWIGQNHAADASDTDQGDLPI